MPESTFETPHERKEVVVKYDSKNTLGFLFQMYGSVWKAVLPYCVCNSALTVFLWHSNSNYGINLSIKDKGHIFMSAMVSFLVVAQTSNSIHRYMDARRLLSDLMRASRELLQHTVSFSRYKVYGEKAKKWREQIANQTVALLNSVSHVLTTSVEWRIKKNYSTIIIKGLSSEKEHLALSYVNGRCDRIPFVHLVKLREIIASHGQALSSPLEAVQELVLLKFTANISEAYHFLLQLVMTRYPFPLVQMTRTFLFVWIFTLPFALLDDVKSLAPLLTIVFFCTYGFVGLELISIEIDDPFGNDPNDFGVHFLVQFAIDDIWVFIEDIDGKPVSVEDDVVVREERGLELSVNDDCSEHSVHSNDEGISYGPSSSAEGF